MMDNSKSIKTEKKGISKALIIGVDKTGILTQNNRIAIEKITKQMIMKKVMNTLQKKKENKRTNKMLTIWNKQTPNLTF
jgi:hypothetical protein